MQFTIVPPKSSGKKPYKKEFANWSEVETYIEHIFNFEERESCD